LTPSSRKDFFEVKNFFSPEAISRVSRTQKMGDENKIKKCPVSRAQGWGALLTY